MPIFVFTIQPGGRERRVLADTEELGRRWVQEGMTQAERDGCSGIECTDVEPLSVIPCGPVVDPFEDLP